MATQSHNVQPLDLLDAKLLYTWLQLPTIPSPQPPLPPACMPCMLAMSCRTPTRKELGTQQQLPQPDLLQDQQGLSTPRARNWHVVCEVEGNTFNSDEKDPNAAELSTAHQQKRHKHH